MGCIIALTVAHLSQRDSFVVCVRNRDTLFIAASTHRENLHRFCLFFLSGQSWTAGDETEVRNTDLCATPRSTRSSTAGSQGAAWTEGPHAQPQRQRWREVETSLASVSGSFVHSCALRNPLIIRGLGFPLKNCQLRESSIFKSGTSWASQDTCLLCIGPLSCPANIFRLDLRRYASDCTD